MRKALSLLFAFTILCGSLTVFSSCGPAEASPVTGKTEPGDASPRQAEFHDAVFREAEAESYDGLQIDFSSTESGYIGVKAVNENRLKFQVLRGEEKYTYDLPGDGRSWRWWRRWGSRWRAGSR